jgi:competence protein ComFC
LRFAAFAHEGPAASLVHQLKFHGREEVVKVLASSLLVQIDRLQKWPDMIVPVPHTPWHAFLRNNYPSKLLARELGNLLNVPVKECLKRSWTSLPQRCKTKEQREKLPKEIYRLQKQKDLIDRTILLVDDVTTTGTTLVRCAEALREGFPRQVIGCTVTLAEKD